MRRRPPQPQQPSAAMRPARGGFPGPARVVAARSCHSRCPRGTRGKGAALRLPGNPGWSRPSRARVRGASGKTRGLPNKQRLLRRPRASPGRSRARSLWVRGSPPHLGTQGCVKLEGTLESSCYTAGLLLPTPFPSSPRAPCMPPHPREQLGVRLRGVFPAALLGNLRGWKLALVLRGWVWGSEAGLGGNPHACLSY